MDEAYCVRDIDRLTSPSLVLFRELVEENVAKMLSIAGPTRLRPHCKTHKMAEIIEIEKKAGITKHKCATLAEATMLATSGIRDILLGYQPVGPNIDLTASFCQRFPNVNLKVLADDSQTIVALGVKLDAVGESAEVLLDVDVGQHRTGLPPGDCALELYRQIASTPGLLPGGLHVYDGHNHQQDLTSRRTAVLQAWEEARRLKNNLIDNGLPVPLIVAGGTGSFPIFAGIEDDTLEVSPGTCVLYDAGYSTIFPDLQFKPAALLLSRVVSRPAEDCITLDLGYKAVSSDPPAEKRVTFPDLPDAQFVMQNEEHLVVRTAEANKFAVGDPLWGIPWHICPSVALHEFAYIISGGKVAGEWDVVARGRRMY